MTMLDLKEAIAVKNQQQQLCARVDMQFKKVTKNKKYGKDRVVVVTKPVMDAAFIDSVTKSIVLSILENPETLTEALDEVRFTLPYLHDAEIRVGITGMNFDEFAYVNLCYSVAVMVATAVDECLTYWDSDTYNKGASVLRTLDAIETKQEQNILIRKVLEEYMAGLHKLRNDGAIDERNEFYKFIIANDAV